ncbi:hypothetical protein D3C78_507360 [compost metagenome]
MTHTVDLFEQVRQGQMPALRSMQAGLSRAAQVLGMAGNRSDAVTHLLDGHRNRSHSSGLRRGTLGHPCRGPHQLLSRGADGSRHTCDLAHGLLKAVDQFVEGLRRVSDFVATDNSHTPG